MVVDGGGGGVGGGGGGGGGGGLLASDVARAREGLDAWRCGVAAEARLERALKECSGTAALAKALQEAAAAGVKVEFKGRGGDKARTLWMYSRRHVCHAY
jgi:hypothetical protein